jgi:UDP-N-acetyl-2-amino-2-deoxyglucuronate dehydrogenase
MESTRRKFALIGCGRIAQRHAEQINAHGTLVAAFDVVPDAAEAFCAKYGGKPYSSLEALLQGDHGAEVISVCSPNSFHAANTLAALRAGYHVLCEKPMAISVADCGEMIQVAERANKRLFIVKQNRFNPPVEFVKGLIDQGKLGRVLSCHLSCFWNRNEQYYKDSWRGTVSVDGGTLYTLFSHFVDLLYWMIGDIATVEAITGNQAHGDMIEFEDTGGAVFRFYNGAIGTLNYTTNAFGGNMEGSLTLFGEKGTVKIGGQYLNELEYFKVEGVDAPDLLGLASASGYKHYEGSQSRLDCVYTNLNEVLDGKGMIATGGFEGLKTVEIIDRIYRAARRNDV